MDTHRTPFGGRNYEYYSEDGVLAGQYAVAVVQSAKAGGIFFHIKHCVLNDQDTNRGDRENFRNVDPAIYYMQKAAKDILYAEASSSELTVSGLRMGTASRFGIPFR